MIVLTMIASEGTPNRSERQNPGPWEEMVQRFFFNRISSYRRTRLINKAVQPPLLVFTHTTDPLLVRRDDAVMWTEETLHSIVL